MKQPDNQPNLSAGISAALLLLAFPIFTGAQTAAGQDSVVLGRRPHFTVWIQPRVDGNELASHLVGITDSSLRVVAAQSRGGWERPRPVLEIPTAQVERVYYRGRGKMALAGIVGGLIGLAGGLVIGDAAAPRCADCFIDVRRLNSSVAGGLIGLPLGVMAGLGIGRARRSVHIGGERLLLPGQRNKLERLGGWLLKLPR